MLNFSIPTDTKSVVVDENAAAFKRLGQKFKGHVVVGTGIDYDVLKRAGAATADGFVAVTNGDNRNIMAALIAQRMFKIKQIVARIYDPPRGQMYRELGVQTVCPTTVGAKLIRDVLIDAPWENQAFDFGKLTSVAALVGPADAGKRVVEIEEDGTHSNLRRPASGRPSSWPRAISCFKKATRSMPSSRPMRSATSPNAFAARLCNRK